jgi:hypothetical protein
MRKIRPFGIFLLSVAAVSQPVQAQQAPIKPQFHGLLNRGRISVDKPNAAPNNSLDEIESLPPGIFDGVTVNIKWVQLQPTPDRLDTIAIDAALADVRSYNQRHPQTPLAVKLRIWQGADAPDWIKNLGGPPVAIVHKDKPITIGRYWSPEYRQAWRTFQTKLAEKYDADPLIREVTNTSCSSVTDEPFVMNVSDKDKKEKEVEALQDLIKAGFTDAAYRDCLMQSAHDYTGWRTTSIDFPVGGYRRIENGKPVRDRQVDSPIMGAFRQVLGARAILSNHALANQEENQGPRGMGSTADLIKQFGPPIEFQTANPKAEWLQGGQLDWESTIRYGISLGASAIEVWDESRKDPGFKGIPPEKLREWSVALKNNQIQNGSPGSN